MSFNRIDVREALEYDELHGLPHAPWLERILAEEENNQQEPWTI